MLVLKRNAEQRVLIGNDIVVTVTKIVGNKVYLGFEAPDDVRIVREEAKNKEKQDGNGSE